MYLAAHTHMHVPEHLGEGTFIVEGLLDVVEDTPPHAVVEEGGTLLGFTVQQLNTL